MQRRATVFLLLLLALVAGGASAQAAPCEAPAVRAVATVGMIADVVRNVGGPCVAVTQLMGAGVDPHLYRASEGDVFTLLEADVVFYGGLNLEARLAEIFLEMNALGLKPTVAVSEAVPPELRLIEANYQQVDPHVWMDVSLWRYTIGVVRDTLSGMDPARTDFYAETAAAYDAELAALDAYVLEQIARIPEPQRVLVTAHDAFQYYGHRYGIQVHAPQGITTSTEAGVEDIRETIALIAERRIPAVFVESSVPPDVVEAIIEGARARGQEIAIGGSLFSDAMGDAGTFEGTYVGMITHNTDTIVRSLAGA